MYNCVADMSPGLVTCIPFPEVQISLLSHRDSNHVLLNISTSSCLYNPVSFGTNKVLSNRTHQIAIVTIDGIIQVPTLILQICRGLRSFELLVDLP